MFYMGKRVPVKKLTQMAQDFSDQTHRRCALTFLCKVFLAAQVVCYADVVDACEDGTKACFSLEELSSTWEYLINQGFIDVIEIIWPYSGTVYICPHLGVGADYKHRRRLCPDCRQEFLEKKPIGQMLKLTAEELRRAFGEPIDWPDELD